MRAMPGVWTFVETPLDAPPALRVDTLAVIRDDESWSALVPESDEQCGAERFGVFSFHFPPDVDNSGFVGWLAGELKQRLGTGVFGVCGSNSARGGIYDYWSCPIDLAPDVASVIAELARPA